MQGADLPVLIPRITFPRLVHEAEEPVIQGEEKLPPFTSVLVWLLLTIVGWGLIGAMVTLL